MIRWFVIATMAVVAYFLAGCATPMVAPREAMLLDDARQLLEPRIVQTEAAPPIR